MDRIVNFSFQEDFIQSLADLTEKEYLVKNRDLSRLAFVFGGKRPELFLKKALAAKLKKGFVSPSFFSIDEFIDFILYSAGREFKKVTELEAAYLLFCLTREKACQQLKERDSFASFLPWAREILAFIEQLDLENIGLEPLKSVELNAAIGFDIPENINMLLADIISLRRSFHQELNKRKAYTRGMRYLLASSLAGKLEIAAYDDILFCNLFYLQGSEKKIIGDLYRNERASLVFQGGSERFSVLKDLEREFNCEIRTIEPEPTERNLRLYSCFDGQSQAGTVKSILSGLKSPEQTVIVLPCPEKIITLLSEITAELKDFNVSMGYPFKRTPVFSLFAAVFKAQKSRKNGQYYAPDYLKLLTHPLVKNFRILPEPSSTRMLAHKVEEFLIGMEKSDLGGSLFVSLKEIESLDELYVKTSELSEKVDNPSGKTELKEALCFLHELLFYSWEIVSSFNSLSKNLSVFIEFLLKKSFLENYPLNLKVIQRIIEIGKELESSRFSRETFPQEDIFKIFLNALESELLSFSGSPLKGLQILGLFETRSLNFKNVIILDVNESVLPNLKIYEPLIPREIMLKLGLNRLEKEEEIQRYQFDRLISHAENIFLIFEQGRDKEKSRFIEDLVWSKQKKQSNLNIIPIPRSCFNVEVLVRKKEARKNSEITGYLEKFVYSATNINTYLKCPLRFYYQYVLCLEEKMDLLEEPEGRQIGNFIHALLEETFKKFLGKKLEINPDFKKYFFELFEKRFDEVFLRTMKSDSFLLKEIIRFRMERFLEEEDKREVLEVLMLERKFNEKFALSSGIDYNFTMKVDRVDRLKDDSLLILDYKTGGAEVKPKSLEKIKDNGFSRDALKKTVGSFQMPLYLYFIRKRMPVWNTINAAIYNLKTAQIDYFLKSNDFSRVDEIEEVFMSAFNFLVAEIINPQVSFEADNQDARYCRNCPFFYLCR